MTTDLAVQAYALNTGWLDEKYLNTTATAAATTNGCLTVSGSCVTPYYNQNTYWYYYPSPDRRPIRLGLSEVEKLRSCAKRDAKLKKILEKFTDQIEVVVDFK